MRQKAIVVITVITVVVIAAAPASAAKPEINELHFVLDDQNCSGGVSYDLELNGWEIVRNEGEKATFKVKLDGQVTASNGVLIRVNHNWQETYDYAQRTWTVTGVAYGTWVLGGPGKIVDRGRIVVHLDTDGVLSQAGHFHEPFDPHELTCELIHSVSG